MGQGVQLNYRGEARYGTICGGVISLITFFFFAIFVLLQLYTWMFKPNFNQLEEVSYISRKHREVYDIPFSTFLPTFILIDNGQCVEKFWGNDTTYNSNDLWKFEYNQEDSNGVRNKIPAVNCYDMIQKWTDISENEKTALLNEIKYPDDTLCPNVTSMMIYGGEGSDTASFWLAVYAQDEDVYENKADCGMIYVADISRYFNVDEYLDNGYMDYITLSEETYYFQYAT